ncbi:ABC transporter ATP-binding protein [Lactovum odontotermitis]
MAQAGKQTIIEFKNFSFQYLAQMEPTLHDINLKIFSGEKVLIVGPSGSGKSTLMACINGLIPHAFKGNAEGELLIEGKSVFGQELFVRSESVGTVLQDPDGQFIGLTVGEDIAFSLENKEVEVPEMHRRVRESARRVRMEDWLDQEPHALSGGQKQRVSLSGVLVDAVKILLFDEPLANLDPLAGKSAIALIDEVGRESEATTIIVEHRLEDALFCGVDRIVLINEGRIIADEEPDCLLAQNYLPEAGIREPLYVTVLRYAGLSLDAGMKLSSVTDLSLSSAQKSAVQDWYEAGEGLSDAAGGKILLSIKDLSFAYDSGGPVLEDVSLEIEAGNFIAIVGQNGAGKTTLSKLICGFEKLKQGQILWKGQDLADLTIVERAQHIGYVMQNPNQMISKTMIFDEVALGLRSRGIADEALIREKVEDTLKICGLYPFRNWPVSALSFGQKKRVTIASILVLEPELLILDEPTAGQDYRHYSEMMTFLESLNQRGITIVIITHDMHLMLEYARKCFVFADHKLIAALKPEELMTNSLLLDEADLKETSLFQLAEICGIADKSGFIRRFIDVDRQNRKELQHG